MESSYLNPTTFNVVSNFALSQMSNCEYNDIHWFMTGSSHRIWWTIFIWIFFSCDYLLTRIIVYIHWKEKKKRVNIRYFDYQMIMTFNAVSNFALSQMSNDSWLGPLIEYEEPSSVWIVFSFNYLLTRIQKGPLILM